MSRIFTALFLAASLFLLPSCQNDLSDIGNSLVGSEVSIVVDSLPYNLNGESVWSDSFDSRAVTKLLGRLSVPEYGKLSCSFVSQLMPSTKMNVPDSITEEAVDSMRLQLFVPRGSLTGDSLAPQQLKVYRLTRQLPSDITSNFNPEGYYDPSHSLGSKSYTISSIARGDTAFLKDANVVINVMMPKDLALELFRRYRANDPIFQWPQSFAQWFPGIYVEQNFGNGCVANIAHIQSQLYWHRPERRSYKDDEGNTKYHTVSVRDSICLLAMQPEVLSSNNISFEPSQKLIDVASDQTLVTSPGGYTATVRFPLKSVWDRYQSANSEMSVVSGLGMDIPAHSVKNDYGIEPAPNLLMVRKSEREAFFRENKVPDNINSFTATYDADNGVYKFRNMRKYFLKVLEDYRNGELPAIEDEEFELIPVSITTEDVSDYSSTVTYVVKVSPYLTAPSMTVLDTSGAKVFFTFSSQTIM